MLGTSVYERALLVRKQGTPVKLVRKGGFDVGEFSVPQAGPWGIFWPPYPPSTVCARLVAPLTGKVWNRPQTRLLGNVRPRLVRHKMFPFATSHRL